MRGTFKPEVGLQIQAGSLPGCHLMLQRSQAVCLRIHRFTGQHRLKGGAQVAAVRGLAVAGTAWRRG